MNGIGNAFAHPGDGLETVLRIQHVDILAEIANVLARVLKGDNAEPVLIEDLEPGGYAI